MRCHACDASLNLPGFMGPSDIYCRHCADEQGNLKSFEEVRDSIAPWFVFWQGPMSTEEAKLRAESFMRTLPAWAQD